MKIGLKIISVILLTGMVYFGWAQNTGKVLLYEQNFNDPKNNGYKIDSVGVLPVHPINNPPGAGIWYVDRSMMWLRIDNCSSSGYTAGSYRYYGNVWTGAAGANGVNATGCIGLTGVTDQNTSGTAPNVTLTTISNDATRPLGFFKYYKDLQFNGAVPVGAYVRLGLVGTRDLEIEFDTKMESTSNTNYYQVVYKTAINNSAFTILNSGGPNSNGAYYSSSSITKNYRVPLPASVILANITDDFQFGFQLIYQYSPVTPCVTTNASNVAIDNVKVWGCPAAGRKAQGV